MSNHFETALLLIASTRAALKNGVKHYDIHNNFLATEEQILTALQRDGNITFDVSERIQVTTDETELEWLKRELGGQIGH